MFGSRGVMLMLLRLLLGLLSGKLLAPATTDRLSMLPVIITLCVPLVLCPGLSVKGASGELKPLMTKLGVNVVVNALLLVKV